MLPFFGIIVGLVIGYAVNFTVPLEYSAYVAISILAALDSVFGGITATMNKNFNMPVFITGFFGNALIAAGLTYIGKRLDVDLNLAAVIVFGSRLFNNFAIMRRILIDRYMKKTAQ